MAKDAKGGKKDDIDEEIDEDYEDDFDDDEAQKTVAKTDKAPKPLGSDTSKTTKAEPTKVVSKPAAAASVISQPTDDAKKKPLDPKLAGQAQKVEVDQKKVKTDPPIA